MSRYPPSDYRGPRDRSRSPPRYNDRRASAANIFDNRPPGPPRTSSDAPRGPRSQFDGPPRVPPISTSGAGPASRPSYSSLRDAPPLSSTERGRPFREREYDRRDRIPSPRERSPPRNFKEPRDFPPRDIDITRRRPSSRDGPPSASSTYSDFSSAASFRGGLGRGRGRGDYEFRGGRGGRRPDERPDLFRRDRSPGPRWGGRDLSRDGRDPDRRDERRFERHDGDRWAPEWPDRERELDRRRDPPQTRPEPRQSVDSASTTPTHYQPPPASAINPDRLAMIEGAGSDVTARRPSQPAIAQPPPRRDLPETPAYLNGRAETSRFNQRGSSPPTQAPPVPAFTFAPSAANNNPSRLGDDTIEAGEIQVTSREPPSAPKAHFAEPPPTAPKAPRAHEPEPPSGPPTRTHSISTSNAPPNVGQGGPSLAGSAATSPHQSMSNSSGFAQPPTGPRAARASPAQSSISPRVPLESPRVEQGGFQPSARGQTPPPSAPSGPRNHAFSVSPKVTTNIPTAPKADRALPTAPRAADRAPPPPGRPGERPGGSWAPPTAPRGSAWQYQWRRPGVPGFGNDKTVPAKRDFPSEEKENAPYGRRLDNDSAKRIKSEDTSRPGTASRPTNEDNMDIDSERTRPKQNSISGATAAQSFFGKPSIENPEEQSLSDAADGPMSSSEDDDLNPEEDAALFNAKFERQRRALEAQLVDLSAREYRATTPLESIARLARISAGDLQRLKDQQNEMDVDPPSTANTRPQGVRASQSDDGPDIPTPTGEDKNDVVIQSQEDTAVAIRRMRRRSPEVISLPFLEKEPKPFDQDVVFQETLRRQEDTKALAISVVEQEIMDEDDSLAELEHEFLHLYRNWRMECEDFDRDRERLEDLERQQSQEPGPEIEIPTAVPANLSEGRRLLKHSSEYELELVLKQSEETARIEQERQERESKRLQADMEKEARLPDQQSEEEFKRNLFIDANRLREAETLTLVFTYQPPADTFTEEEQRIFIAAFKETPKKWGEIASLLPGRTYKDCIHHYYANKWDNRFRDSRTRRLKAGGGRGRGRGGKSVRGRGAGLMADLGKTDDLVPAVNDNGRPKRAAAPTTFAERDTSDSKNTNAGISPAKKLGAGGKQDDEKPGKRRKGVGEKPGRKPKATQPLAALAAAPTASPNKTFVDPARAQNLEDASLLTGFQSGRHGAFASDTFAQQDTFMQQSLPIEEPTRTKPVQASSAKPAASSYWSVPEQTDFAKYIAHFGTNFAAIAVHMGTKTQTMIRNHYQRQIDGGKGPELEEAARLADQRREQGHDPGAPPTPTPINKRKYDNPQAPAPRALAPHKETIDVPERPVSRQQQTPKHASPSQYPSQPRFTSAAQVPPVAAQRVAPSPVPAAATPAVSHVQPTSTPGRPVQHAPHQQQQTQTQQYPLGSRLTFLSEPARPESRPGTQPASSLRQPHEGLSIFSARGSTSQQAGRPSAADPSYLQGLVAQQEQALRVQQEQSQQERVEQGFPRQHAFQHGSNHGSPNVKPMHEPPQPPPSTRGPDRPLFKDERPPSPARTFSSTPGLSRPLLGAPMFGSLGSAGFSSSSSISDRSPFSHSPTKRDEHRPSHVPPTSAPTPAPEPPKRSNLLSILNSDPEPAPKREYPPAATPRTASPAPGGFSQSSTPAPLSSLSQTHPSRDVFGQSVPPSHRFAASSAFATPRDTPAPPSSLKHESSIGAQSSQSTKVDWASKVLGNAPQPRQPSPPNVDRDSRPFFSGHRASAFGALNQATRGNPSPPPALQMVGHSRTPSLQTAQPRDVRGMTGHPAPPTPHQNILQPGPYGQQPPGPSFSQPPPTQAQSQSHHAHGSSMAGGYPPFHQRAPSRDEPRRGPDEHAFAAMRDREQQEMRRRHDFIEIERREREREREREFQARQREHEQRQQPSFQPSHTVGQPQPMQTAFGHPPSYSSRLGVSGLREAPARGGEPGYRSEALQSEEEQRRIMDAERRHHEDEYRRRQEEALYQQQRRTPLGGSGGYSIPPPSGPPHGRR